MVVRSWNISSALRSLNLVDRVELEQCGARYVVGALLSNC